MIYIEFLELHHHIKPLVYETYTHPTFVNNTSLYHIILLQKWFDQEIIKINQENNAKYIVNNNIVPDKVEVKDDDVYITDRPLIVAVQYDQKGKPKNLPHPHLTHLEISINNVLKPGLTQLCT